MVEALRAHGEAAVRDRRRRIEAAWLTAVLSRANKVPPLAEILGEREPEREERVPLEGTAEHAERLKRMQELAAIGPPIG